LVGGVTAVKVGKICAAVGALELAVTTTVGPFGKNADCSLAIFVFQGYLLASAVVVSSRSTSIRTGHSMIMYAR